jgi:hypothetical protein
MNSALGRKKVAATFAKATVVKEGAKIDPLRFLPLVRLFAAKLPSFTLWLCDFVVNPPFPAFRSGLTTKAQSHEEPNVDSPSIARRRILRNRPFASVPIRAIGG